MVDTILYIITTSIALYIAWLYHLHLRAKAKVSHIPGVSRFLPHYIPIPFQASKPAFRTTKDELVPKFGPIFSAVTYLMPGIVVADPEKVREVFIKKTKKYDKWTSVYEPFNYFGANILTSRGESWRKHRVLCNPAFTDRNLRYVCTATVDSVSRQIQQWTSANPDTEHFKINTLDDMMKITLQVIGDAGFGYDLRAVEGDNINFDATKHQMPFRTALVTLVMGLFFRFRLPRIMWNMPFGFFKRVNDTTAEFEKYMDVIIEKKRKEIEDPNSEVNSADLLSILINSTSQDEDYSGQRLTDRELKADIYMFMLAGHETTATLMMWTLWLLGKNPDKQQKLQEELDSVIGDASPTFEDIEDRLPYLHYVIKEVLRMRPPVTTVVKEAMEDDYIGDHFIPKGAVMSVPIYYLQNSELYWKDADKFVPERWDNSLPDHTDPKPFTYMPFSVGQRNCIGLRFAQNEAHTILAVLMQHFTVELTEEQKKMEFPEERVLLTLQVKEPLFLTLKKRKPMKAA